MGQLVNGHGVPVLVDVAVDLGPVVLEIVGRFQLHSLLTLGHRVGEAGDHRPFALALVQKLHQAPQLLPHPLQKKQVARLPKGVGLHLFEQGQLVLHLGNGGLALQQGGGVPELPLGMAQRGHLFQLGQHQPIHEVVKPLGQLVGVRVVHQRRNLPLQLSLGLIAQAGEHVPIAVLVHILTV